MFNISLDDTIAAISTPVGQGGIGIVRLSGKDAVKIADTIFISKNGRSPSGFRTYTVNYGHIVERERGTDSVRSIIDEVLLTVMRAPKSYTKEDVVEINCHSGIVTLRKILDLVLANGARLAEPGEFTKRAFLNGRIDIVQAESVIDVIRAKTDISLRAAMSSLNGLFSKRIEDIRSGLVDILAYLEASIDFTEEDDTNRIERKDIFNRIRSITKKIERLMSTGYEGRFLRQGINTVICGAPNVGKSSLMNALLKDPRSIITHLPGTTRDTIEEIVNIKGIPVVLVDTAGINKTEHPVEKEGVKRSYLSIERADLILFVLDYARKINDDDINLARRIKERDNIIIVVNKKDLRKAINISNVRKLLCNRPLVYISTINSSGIDKLEEMICNIIFKGNVFSQDLVTVSNDRQLGALRRSLEELKEALSFYEDAAPLDCISVYIRSAIENLGILTGETIDEETLDRIFSEFCVGK